MDTQNNLVNNGLVCGFNYEWGSLNESNVLPQYFLIRKMYIFAWRRKFTLRTQGLYRHSPQEIFLQ